jgi:diguanylate cyclase (GGDEF)-like protein
MKKIMLLSNDAALNTTIIENLGGRYTVTLLNNVNQLFELCITSTPDLILLDEETLHMNTASTISAFKSDPLFGYLPILAVIRDINGFFAMHLESLIDDYIISPFERNDLALRIEVCTTRAAKILELNPLTRLPGNISIIEEIQRRIDSHSIFALAYADIDNFKPFNDRYGFSRGDEVIRMTARLITNINKATSPSEGFIGHIGGDDFISIQSVDTVEKACSELIGKFDEIIPSFYDPLDRERGFIESTNREGKVRTFTFLTLSIGVAHNSQRKFTHYGQVSEIAAEMKKFAKTFEGSCYRIDRRQS